MRNRSYKGKFITFEGGDGVGKTTNIAFLTKVLSEAGVEVIRLREPGGTPIGEALRKVVLDADNAGMSPTCELLIYEAARAQLVEEVIQPALSRGACVLCDRFTDSTIAYQGYAHGLNLDTVKVANDIATNGLVPDKTLLLVCSNRKDSLSRLDRRKATDRLEQEGQDLQFQVTDGFKHLLETDPDRISVIDTSGKHSETAMKIFDALRDLFPNELEMTTDLEEKLKAYDRAHDHRGCK